MIADIIVIRSGMIYMSAIVRKGADWSEQMKFIIAKHRCRASGAARRVPAAIRPRGNRNQLDDAEICIIASDGLCPLLSGLW